MGIFDDIKNKVKDELPGLKDIASKQLRDAASKAITKQTKTTAAAPNAVQEIKDVATSSAGIGMAGLAIAGLVAFLVLRKK